MASWDDNSPNPTSPSILLAAPSRIGIPERRSRMASNDSRRPRGQPFSPSREKTKRQCQSVNVSNRRSCSLPAKEPTSARSHCYLTYACITFYIIQWERYNQNSAPFPLVGLSSLQSRPSNDPLVSLSILAEASKPLRCRRISTAIAVPASVPRCRRASTAALRCSCGYPSLPPPLPRLSPVVLPQAESYATAPCVSHATAPCVSYATAPRVSRATAPCVSSGSVATGPTSDTNVAPGCFRHRPPRRKGAVMNGRHGCTTQLYLEIQAN